MEKRDWLRKRFAQNESIVAREIGDQFILVPIREMAREVEDIYCLNAVGACIWRLMDGQRRALQVAELVTQEYDVSSEQAQADLAEFVAKLQSIGAIIEVRNGMPEDPGD